MKVTTGNLNANKNLIEREKLLLEEIERLKDKNEELTKQLTLTNVVKQSEELVCGCGKNKPITREPAYLHCDWCDRTFTE